VYLDGHLVASLKGYTSAYSYVMLKGVDLGPGKHTLAIHCKQTRGGQFIDCGISRLP